MPLDEVVVGVPTRRLEVWLLVGVVCVQRRHWGVRCWCRLVGVFLRTRTTVAWRLGVAIAASLTPWTGGGGGGLSGAALVLRVRLYSLLGWPDKIRVGLIVPIHGNTNSK